MPGARFAIAALLLLGPAASAGQWDGPATGPPAQQGKRVVFLASDSRNGGVTGVFRGFEEAARRLGWEKAFLDGKGQPEIQGELFQKAIERHPDGIILGGFNASDFPRQVQQARQAGIVLAGWHAGTTAGPGANLFVNISTDPAAVARLAVEFVLKDALDRHRPVGVVLFTDSQFEVARAKTEAMAGLIKAAKVPGAGVLEIADLPISDAARRVPEAVPKLAARFGTSWTYSLAINDVYFDHINFPLVFAHRTDVVSVSAGDGSSMAFSRIRSGYSQQAATVAEPLRLQGFQLADELNRAFAGKAPSGYLSKPVLVTAERLKSGPPDAGLGYEEAYGRIWSGR